MRFCVSVCEFDPFHIGHQKLIDEMKARGDAVIIIMSGNFCQRGEIAVLDKYARARHAVLAGADAVFELPTVFATAPAEIFAKGAIKLLSSLAGEKLLVFGAENGERDGFLRAAKALCSETKEFKKVLKEQLKSGVPFAKARETAVEKTCEDVDSSLLSSPNSVLGLEYTKAVISCGSDMDICPIRREGSFCDDALGEGYPSALAIRNAIGSGKKKKAKGYVPPFVYDDLPDKLPDLDTAAIYAALAAKKSDMKNIVDCTEGLENRIKAVSRGVRTFSELIDKLETRRYTRARLSRVVLSNMLGVDRGLVERSLKSDLYLKVLAVSSERKDLLSLCGGKTPLLTRKADADKLTGASKECFMKDVFACDVYSLLTGAKMNEYDMKIVNVDRGSK